MSAIGDDFIKLDLFGRIDALAEKMLAQDPQLPIHLASIHKTLIQYEELAHLLSEEQLTVLVEAQKKHTRVELVKEVTQKRVRVPKTTVDDL